MWPSERVPGAGLAADIPAAPLELTTGAGGYWMGDGPPGAIHLLLGLASAGAVPVLETKPVGGELAGAQAQEPLVALVGEGDHVGERVA
jgi:hypothetical protein